MSLFFFLLEGQDGFLTLSCLQRLHLWSTSVRAAPISVMLSPMPPPTLLQHTRQGAAVFFAAVLSLELALPRRILLGGVCRILVGTSSTSFLICESTSKLSLGKNRQRFCGFLAEGFGASSNFGIPNTFTPFQSREVFGFPFHFLPLFYLPTSFHHTNCCWHPRLAIPSKNSLPFWAVFHARRPLERSREGIARLRI